MFCSTAIGFDLQAVDLAAGVRTLTSGRGADIVFDVVGGAMLEKCLTAPGSAWTLGGDQF
jgi:NADPH:quinone reductase-like Zn-dependent oxidoreductase